MSTECAECEMDLRGPHLDSCSRSDRIVGTKCWDGAILKPCKRCSVDDWEQLSDEDHDGGSCEIFRCKPCGRIIHVELPD